MNNIDHPPIAAQACQTAKAMALHLLLKRMDWRAVFAIGEARDG